MERPKWQWSPSLRKYYFFDARTGDYVLQDGTRHRRVDTYGRNASRSNTQNISGPSSSDASNVDPWSPARHPYTSPMPALQPSGQGQHYTSARPGPQPLTQALAVPAIVGALRNDSNVRRPYSPPQRAQLMGENDPTGVPPSTIDPVLLQAGIQAQRALLGTSGETEPLYPNFKVRRRDFFCIGRVFLVLWVEPAGESSTSVISALDQSDRSLSTGAFNERVYSKVRRFVVIRERDTYCNALPIVTYGHQGVAKSGVAKSEHAIIYTGRHAPSPLPNELPNRGEQAMMPTPIRVVPDDKTESLDPKSRLDFGKVHTVAHNIKVRSLGIVHAESMDALRGQFAEVWMGSGPKGVLPKPSEKAADELAESASTLAQLDLRHYSSRQPGHPNADNLRVDILKAIFNAKRFVENWWKELSESRSGSTSDVGQRHAECRIIVGFGGPSEDDKRKLGPALRSALRADGWEVEHAGTALVVKGRLPEDDDDPEDGSEDSDEEDDDDEEDYIAA